MFRMPWRRERRVPPDEANAGPRTLSYRPREDDERHRADDADDGFLHPQANLKSLRELAVGFVVEGFGWLIIGALAIAIATWMGC